MYISAVKTFLPGKVITNEILCKHINFRPQLIEKLFGNRGRYYFTNLDTGKVEYSVADSLAIVIDKLLKINNHIEFIILSTATSDYLLPTSINEACYQLKLKNIETYQIVGGCSGALQALNLAKYILKSGVYKTGIVIGIESSVKFLDFFNTEGRTIETKELVNYTLFGDGVGGCIVTSEQQENSVYVKDIYYKYLGLDEPIGQLANWKGTRSDLSYEPMLLEQYKLIEKLVPELTIEIIHKWLQENPGKSLNDIWFMPPQLSGKMVDFLCKKIGYTGHKTITKVADIGNCANAAVYYQIEDFFNQVQKGEDGLAISIESSRWLSSMIHLYKGHE